MRTRRFHAFAGIAGAAVSAAWRWFPPCRAGRRAVLAAAAAVCCTAAVAHKSSDAYLTLTVQGDHVLVRWDVALRDLDNELGLDADDDGALTWQEVRSRGGDIAALVLPTLGLSSSRGACRVVKDGDDSAPHLPGAAVSPGGDGGATGQGVRMELDHHSDGTYAVLQWTAACPGAIDTLRVDYHLFARADPTHRGIVRVVAASAPSAASMTAVLGPDNPQRRFDLARPALLETLREFVTEGIWHIWLGFDHILFLLSLLLPAVLIGRSPAAGGPPAVAQTVRGPLIDVLKTVTAFTLAHSITLSLAVLNIVSLPSRLVESGIALTVVFASLNNLWPVVRDYRWLAAFAFGLIHGFGFAAALKDLGLSAGSLAISLFGFNLGVELGQLAIVATFVPLAFLLRKTRFYRLGIMGAGSAAVALVASVWFVERAFDISVPGFGP
jgi:hypothetical protein